MLLSGSVLVVSGGWKLSEGELGDINRPKAASDLLDCISARKIRICSSVWNSPLTLTAGLLRPHLGYYGSVQSLYSAV